jgi:hypothetical protein
MNVKAMDLRSVSCSHVCDNSGPARYAEDMIANGLDGPWVLCGASGQVIDVLIAHRAFGTFLLSYCVRCVGEAEDNIRSGRSFGWSMETSVPSLEPSAPVEPPTTAWEW